MGIKVKLKKCFAQNSMKFPDLHRKVIYFNLASSWGKVGGYVAKTFLLEIQ